MENVLNYQNVWQTPLFTKAVIGGISKQNSDLKILNVFNWCQIHIICIYFITSLARLWLNYKSVNKRIVLIVWLADSLSWVSPSTMLPPDQSTLPPSASWSHLVLVFILYFFEDADSSVQFNLIVAFNKNTIGLIEASRSNSKAEQERLENRRTIISHFSLQHWNLLIPIPSKCKNNIKLCEKIFWNKYLSYKQLGVQPCLTPRFK